MNRQALAVFLALAVMLPWAATLRAEPLPRLTTDQSDYPAGATAQISGSGFAAGESVQLRVLRIDVPENLGAEHDPWTVTADDVGSFQTVWEVTPDEVGATLQLTATGLTSGYLAQVTFTDGIGWYDTAWAYRKTITINHTKVRNTEQTHFPILVSLSHRHRVVCPRAG